MSLFLLVCIRELANTYLWNLELDELCDFMGCLFELVQALWSPRTTAEGRTVGARGVSFEDATISAMPSMRR